MLAQVDGAVLIHCAAGKGRTGRPVALIHHAMGVAYDDILADYELANQAIWWKVRLPDLAETMRRIYGTSADQDVLHAFLNGQGEYLDGAFLSVKRRHGSVDNYLSDALGVMLEVVVQLDPNLIDAEFEHLS